MNKSNTKKIDLTADCVLVYDEKVLMEHRKIDPYKGEWVLPGGHVEYGETAEQALRREVFEELGIELKNKFKLVGVYSDPERDPRGHTISCAYLIKVSELDKIRLNEESDDFDFFEFKDLPEDIGFDHRKIIKDAENKFIN